MCSDSKILKLFNKLSITIDSSILSVALTHSSKTFEDSVPENYERLEFLGDSVLKLVISELLYTRYPDYNEGRMSKIRSILVSDATLFELSEKINLKSAVILGKNEEKDGGRNKESVIASALEAILGAIFISCGIIKAKSFIIDLFDDLPQIVDKKLEYYNAKAVLQEYTQEKSKELPKYIEMSVDGLDHKKTFEFGVYYNGNLLATGNGLTKKEAQQDAAQKACIKLGILKEAEIV